MIKISDYQTIMDTLHGIVQEQTQGITEEESLLQPVNGGNCMRWVVGHLCTNLESILDVLGVEVHDTRLDRFDRGSDRLEGDEADILTLAELLDVYGTLHTKLVDRLKGMQPEQFNDNIGTAERPRTRGYMALFLQFHHSYHVGQLELLRNLAGHTEKLI
ncbi:MAG TPA: DinB family protein [Bellilinea sp.]|nr:DinB family protein [Bellilinea sp.]